MVVLRNARKDDSRDIFAWRNDPATRKASFHSAKITYKEHQKWFANALNSSDRMLFVAVLKDVPIGVVRADAIEDGFEISWNVAPEKRGNGFGKKMVKALIEKLDTRCVALIKSDNKASKKIAESCGMILFSKKNNVCKYIKEQGEK